MSTTGQQQIQKNETNQSVNMFGNERAKTAKLAANEEEMKRTRVLMDKISGKHNIDQRFLSRPETGKS